MKTLTAMAKKQITADWAAQFPELGVYCPLHLLRRVMPLVEGIVLERTSGNDVYRPTFHVHCLARAFPVVSMAMAHPLRADRSGAPESIPVLHHAARYFDAADRLRRKAPLGLSGNLRLSDVVKAYRVYLTAPGVHYDAHLLYEDAARICAWAGAAKEANGLLAEGRAALSAWPQASIDAIGGVESWATRVAEAIADRDALRALADEEVRRLKLDALPVAQLIVT